MIFAVNSHIHIYAVNKARTYNMNQQQWSHASLLLSSATVINFVALHCGVGVNHGPLGLGLNLDWLCVNAVLGLLLV